MNIDDFKKKLFDFQHNLGNTILDIADFDKENICDENGILRFTMTLNMSRDEQSTITMDCEANGFYFYTSKTRPEFSLVDDV
jgi:hypothetical protein